MISGVIRGAGHQLWGAAATFIAFYLVGLPIGISLALATDLGVVGMWVGLLCGSVTHAAIYIVILLAFNWQKESEHAIKTASDAHKPATHKNDLEHHSSERTTETPLTSKVLEIDLEEVQLLQDDSDNDALVCPEYQHCSSDTKWKIKLLISRGGVFIVGILLVISAGITSQYHPPKSIINGNYSECTGNLTDSFSMPYPTPI